MKLRCPKGCGTRRSTTRARYCTCGAKKQPVVKSRRLGPNESPLPVVPGRLAVPAPETRRT